VYAELIRRASCDDDIAEVSFFGFRDDGLRTGFQAALQRLDGTARPAAEAVRTAIADAAAAGCAGSPVRWAPRLEVLSPSAALERGTTGGLAVRLTAGEDARARVCLAAKRSTPARCRAAALAGHRPLAVALAGRGVQGRRAEIAVELVAMANRARRTVLHLRAR
jgi:hypothetical protein